MNKINVLSQAMLKQFEDMKNETEIMKEFEEIDDDYQTNNAIKELYPDMEFTITDIVNNDNIYSSKALNSFVNPRTTTSQPKSRSVMGAYGQNSLNKSLNRSSVSDYRQSSIQNRKKSTSLESIKARAGELINVLPDIRSRSPHKSIHNSQSKFGDPLGLRRLGVYKGTRFSISSKSRATGPTSQSSIAHNMSIASDKTTRFARSIHYE